MTVTALAMLQPPVTTPDEVPIAATAVLLELHVPPVAVLSKVIVRPVHVPAGPVMAGGAAFTVIVCVAAQPATV